MTSDRGAAARDSAVGQRSSQRRYRGMMRSTCVCWSMTSLTRIAYGSRVRRQGRSRPSAAYQSRRSPSSSAIEARLFEVEVPDDAAHDEIVDPPLAPQVEYGASLGGQQLAQQALVVERTALELAVGLRVEAAAEALAAEVEHRAHALERVVAHPILVGELLQPAERGLGRIDARLVLLLLRAPLVPEAEKLEEGGEGQALDDERGEDDAEGEEDDQVAVREGAAGIGGQRESKSCCERDRAPHPRPADDDRRPAGVLDRALHPPDPRGQVRPRHDPEEARCDH